MKIGDRIKAMREKRLKTQSELADAVGTTKQNIYKYENGIVTNIPSDRIEAIASFLSVSPAYLMGWTDDPSPEIIDDAPLDVIKYFDGDEEKIAAFMRAVDEDRAAESAEQAQQALLFSLFNKLNSLGKDRALEFIGDLAQMEKYTNEK